jgi:hypothetical protein
MDRILFAVCQDDATARIFKSISWFLGFFQELKRVRLVRLKASERLGPSRSYQLKSEIGKIKILDAFRLVFEQQHRENSNIRIPQITLHSSSESFAKTIMQLLNRRPEMWLQSCEELIHLMERDAGRNSHI